MARPNTVGERLRAFVRARVRKDGPHYIRGNASRLAEELQVDNGWVTEYTDQPPTSHADIDAALEICRFYRVAITDFETARAPIPAAPATARLTPLEARVVKLLQQMNERGQRLAVKSIAGYAAEFPKTRLPGSLRRSSGTPSATTNTTRGKR